MLQDGLYFLLELLLGTLSIWNDFRHLMAKAECQNVCTLEFDQEKKSMLFSIIKDKPHNELGRCIRKSMLGSSLYIAVNTWSDTIFFEAICEVL